MTFYQTIGLTRRELSEYHEKSITQERLIQTLFEKNPGQSFTPFEVCRACCFEDMQITSVRRAISDLTKKGVIEKTATYKMGSLGVKNHTWKLAKNQVLLW